MDVAYDGGAADASTGGETQTIGVGTCGAIAVCNTGFWTCVDFTECMIIGCCVFVFLALYGCGCNAIGLEMETCVGPAFCVTVMGLGEPADVPE